jgi:TRAP-type C4-dicarboxylate transport system substrate-binding protein
MSKIRSLTALLTVLGVASSAQAAQYRIRWVLAHEPSGVFEQAAKDFAATVAQESKGDIEVQIVTAKDFGKDIGKGEAVMPDEAAHAVASGRVEMTQTYTTSLGKYSRDLWVLDLPYLFRDHAQAAKVFEGDIGRQLLAGLAPKHMHGLAFTYSGGYRILPTTSREIHRPEDVKGLRVRTSNSPVAQATIRALGGEPVPAWIDQTVPMAKAGKIDAGETTLARFADGRQDEGLPVINDTQHSLFLTAVLINDKFFNSLPKADQAAVQRAATAMARRERQESVDACEAERIAALAKGEKVITLTADEKARFVAALQPVYAEFAPTFGDLVPRIQNTH